MSRYVVMVYGNPSFDESHWFPAAVFDTRDAAVEAARSINTALGNTFCVVEEVEHNPTIETYTQPIYRVIEDFDGDGKHTAWPPISTEMLFGWGEELDLEPCALSRVIPKSHGDEWYIPAANETEAVERLMAILVGKQEARDDER